MYKGNEILVCPKEGGWGSKNVAQSHTILTSPVTTRVKISVREEEATSLIGALVYGKLIHFYFTDQIEKLFNNVRN